MSRLPDVVIVIAHCEKSGGMFGVRVAKSDARTWRATWAFRMEKDVAQREGYGARTIEGEFLLGDEFPGCPYCEQQWLCQCACGCLSCWRGDEHRHCCPECRAEGDVGGAVDRISVTGDR